MRKIEKPVVIINRHDSTSFSVAVTDNSSNWQDARLMAVMELEEHGDDADVWSKIGFYMAAEIENLRQKIQEQMAS
ncbi:hypothetical protein PN744_003236 [Escherichia coli]|nr:hypothetical protein [Escherichia coli]EKK5467296.1 hypothetical protein [Escherichia coli]